MVLKILEFLNSLFVKLWTSFLAMRTSFDIICICKIFLLVSRHDVTSSTCTSLCETLSSFSWMNNANDMNLLFLWAFHHAFLSSLFAICKSNVVTCDQYWVMGHLEACDWSVITHPWLRLVVTGTLLIPAHDHWLLCIILTSKTI